MDPWLPEALFYEGVLRMEEIIVETQRKWLDRPAFSTGDSDFATIKGYLNRHLKIGRSQPDPEKFGGLPKVDPCSLPAVGQGMESSAMANCTKKSARRRGEAQSRIWDLGTPKSQMLHVWYIHLHCDNLKAIVGKYSSTMKHMGCTNMFVFQVVVNLTTIYCKNTSQSW